MINVLDSAAHRNRVYRLADTPLGRIVYFELADGKYTQWRNLTNGDVYWTIKPTTEFQAIHSAKPVEVFVSKRLTGFKRDKAIVKCGGLTYWLAEKSKSDGYLYEIPRTDLYAFPKKQFPDMEFVYTRYHIASCRELDRTTLERLKTEEVVRFNGSWRDHSPYVVSAIVDAVYKYLQGQEAIN